MECPLAGSEKRREILGSWRWALSEADFKDSPSLMFDSPKVSNHDSASRFVSDSEMAFQDC